MKAAVDLHQAGVVEGGDYVSSSVDDARVLFGEHGGRNICILDGEGAAEAAALFLIWELYELQVADGAEQLAGSIADVQHAEGVAGRVVSDFLGELGAYVFEGETIGKQFGELEDAGKEAAHVGQEGRIVLRFSHEDVVLAHHGDAGSGRNADYLGIAKHLHETADEGDGFAVVAGVVVHLATARLFDRELDGVAETLEHTCDRYARFGEERVVVAGDEERDTQGNSPLGTADLILMRLEVGAIADDDSRTDQEEEATAYKDTGAEARALPLAQGDAPERGEDDDAGHVESPACELVLAHARLPHGVEEELEVPDDSGESGKDVVSEQRARSYAGGESAGIEILESVAGGGRGAEWIDALGSGELADRAVFEDEDEGPHKVGDEPAPENDDEHGKILPEFGAMIRLQLAESDEADGLARIETVGKAGTHDPRKDGHSQTAGEREVTLAGLGFLFFRDLALFGQACHATDGHSDQADEDSKKDDLAGERVDDGDDLELACGFAVEEWWQKCAERCTQAESDRVSKTKAEIADGEAEREASHAPQHTPHDRVPNGGTGCLLEDADQIRNEQAGHERWRNQPCCDTLNDPVNFPRPTLDAPERNEIAS